MDEPASDNRPSEPDSLSSFTLGPDDAFEGKLIYAGGIRIEGRVVGELHLTGDVAIAPGAIVKASVEASNVDVEGDVEGPVIARNRLRLRGSGQVAGDVQVG